MLRLLGTLLAGSLLLAPSAWGQSYQLVWQDEFEGTQLDLAKWEPQVGDGCPSLCGWGNNELQYYRAENATVSGGFLTITAKQEFFSGLDYTSARLRTRNRGDWTYGRFEMRAKMPIGQGMWPAFWMLPTDGVYGTWAASGEIDIVELVGHQPATAHGTIHYGGSYPANQSASGSTTLASGTFHDDFHVFALEWEPCEMRWYVDGLLYATQSNWSSTGGPYPAPFDQRFHLLLNLAVGGNWPGSPDGTTVFPQQLVVDYVRVYQAPEYSSCVQVFDGMDHGNPMANGWFSFGGTVGGGGIDANWVDLPPTNGCRASLQTGWGSGGTPGFFGGFGRYHPMDLTGMTHFSFWIHPDAAQDYKLEINLQDDDNGDGIIPATPDGADDEFQFDFLVSPTGPHAISGGGWQYVSIPLSDFVDDNSFHYGGNGVFDPTPSSAGGNGQLINVVVTVTSQSGADVSFRTDRWAFTRQTSAVAGKVWNDTNGDGVQNAGETGIGDVTLELFDGGLGSVVESTVSDGDGVYFFDALLGGAYEVRIDTSTLPPGASPTFDPDGIASADRYAVDLACGMLYFSGNFGYSGVPTDGPPPSTGRTALHQNVPNPFNPGTHIGFDLAEEGFVQLSVYDAAGRRVRTLLHERLPAGAHHVLWNGEDEEGQDVASGVYLYVLRAGELVETKRMVLLR